MSDHAAVGAEVPRLGHVHAGTRATLALVGAYAATIAAAEAVAAFAAPLPAVTIDAVVLTVLLAHYVVSGRRLYAALAIVPLLRLTSIAMALDHPLVFLRPQRRAGAARGRARRGRARAARACSGCTRSGCGRSGTSPSRRPRSALSPRRCWSSSR